MVGHCTSSHECCSSAARPGWPGSGQRSPERRDRSLLRAIRERKQSLIGLVAFLVLMSAEVGLGAVFGRAGTVRLTSLADPRTNSQQASLVLQRSKTCPGVSRSA